MAKTKSILKWCANIILIIGVFGVFNDSSSFVPNFIGLGCFLMLLIINKNQQ